MSINKWNILVSVKTLWMVDTLGRQKRLLSVRTSLSMVTRGVSRTRGNRAGACCIDKLGDASMKVLLTEMILSKYSVRFFNGSDKVF